MVRATNPEPELMTDPQPEALAELRALCARHGNQVRLAEAIGVTRQAVSRWLKVGEVGAEHVLAVERATGIHRHLLNPRIYPDPPLAAAIARA